MSTPSDSTIKGKFDEVAGKVKQGVGEAFHDQSLANSGAADRVKGNAEQAWSSVKEAAQDTKDRKEAHSEAESHDVREKIASTAQNVKNTFRQG